MLGGIIMHIKFPEKFEWGVATASCQIEGAIREDGKGENIWDRFTHIPGNIVDGTNGDMACDFYHLYEEDIRLAKQFGLQVFRLSINWARIYPQGTGEVSEQGIAFYRNVLECLKRNGIKSAVTLYHWDLPQALQDRGGWANRESVEWFRQYACTLFDAYSDLVDYWITLNEPYCSSILGYWSGEHAPGYHDYSQALQVVHHLLMGHGAAVLEFRKRNLVAEIGITLNMNMVHPLDEYSTVDIKAAKRVGMQNNCLFGDPVWKGTYPEEFFDWLEAQGVRRPIIMDGDMELIYQKLDFFGLNNYFANYVKADPDQWPLQATLVKSGRPCTTADWEICPDGMRDLLCWINEEYNPPQIIITENGAANHDVVGIDGRVADPCRIDYLKRYLSAVSQAITEGVPVTGYYVWCFTDNFEWAWGLARRFGLIYVDYKTQTRIPKDSIYWYRDVIKKNGFELPE